jgi:hypothetical protein
MSPAGPIPLPRKHFSFAGAVDPVTATAGLHADSPPAPLAITEPKAETTR